MSSILPIPTSPESSEYVKEPISPMSYLSTDVDKDPVTAMLCVKEIVLPLSNSPEPLNEIDFCIPNLLPSVSKSSFPSLAA